MTTVHKDHFIEAKLSQREQRSWQVTFLVQGGITTAIEVGMSSYIYNGWRRMKMLERHRRLLDSC